MNLQTPDHHRPLSVAALGWREGVVLAAAIAIAAWLSRLLSFSDEGYSLLWPPAGMAFACLLVYGQRGAWPLSVGLMLWAGFSFGQEASVVQSATPFALWLLMVLGSVVTEWVSASVAVAVYLKLNDGVRNLASTRSLLRFGLCVVLVQTPIAGLLGSALFQFAGLLPNVAFGWLYAAYAVSAATGALLFAPWLILILEPVQRARRLPSLRHWLRLDPVSLALMAALALVLALTHALNEVALAEVLIYLIFPIMAVCAIRRSPTVTASTLVVATVLLVVFYSWSFTQENSIANRQQAQAFTAFKTIVIMLITTLITLLLAWVSDAQRRALSDLKRQSRTDTTTGLPNELGFMDQLEALRDARLTRAMAVFELRAMNMDSLLHLLGYSGASRLAQEIASGILALPAEGMVARISHTRFAILLLDVAPDDARQIAHDIYSQVGRVHAPVGSSTLELRCAIGGVWIAAGLPIEAQQALLAAREACAQATRQSGAPIVLTTASAEALRERTLWVERSERLRQQINSGQVALWAQAIVHNQPQQAPKLQLEVLTRLHDTNGDLLTPDEFMPIVHAERLEIAYDRLVIQQSIAWFAHHPEAFDLTEKISINVSGQSVSDSSFADYVAECLEQYQLPAERFCFEITETALIQNFDQAHRWIDSLHHLGATVVLDDFGTGVATFDYLKRLPVDGVKIDGAFIRQLPQSALDEQIVSAVVAIARSLGRYTVAEFVSSDEILERVVALGVDYSQGWAFGKAEPLEHLLQDPQQTVTRLSRSQVMRA